jgi:sulfatase modifying factor 1
MKYFLFTFLIALTATVSSSAQTLQVDPILESGSATFEIQNGTPGAKSMLLISTQGPGPISLLRLGVDIDLTLPIQNLPMESVDALGFSYNTRSYAVPANALVGRQIWFQGLQLDIRANPAVTVTNMVTLTVTDFNNNPPPGPPVAVYDTRTPADCGPLVIDVADNDLDVNNNLDLESVVITQNPAHGIVVVLGGGLVEYTADYAWVGADTFNYHISDLTGLVSNIATVQVDSPGNNELPEANYDAYAMSEADAPQTYDIAANDTVPSGRALDLASVAITQNPAKGNVVNNFDGTVTYAFTGDLSGALSATDIFNYTIRDDCGVLSNVATVEIEITRAVGNEPPNDMVAIPGGTFEMGDHAGVGSWGEQPVHSVTLDAFFMDKYEVSNTKFADFLNNTTVTVGSGGYVYQVGGAGQLICYLSYGLTHNGSAFVIDAGKDNHPAVCQTWYGAALYCNYLSTLDGRTSCYDETTFACDFTADGFRLPTEAEWEYASRGGEHSPYYQYPWGSNTITSSDANYVDSNIGTTVDVGTYAANGYGLYDMAGNAWEWCNDWYDISYYSNSPATNPTGPASGSARVLRGGGWILSAIYLRCAFRGGNYPTYNHSYIGFRVLAVQ